MDRSRRALLAALLVPAAARANRTPPPELAGGTPLTLRGEGRLRVLGFAVYDARLWVGEGFAPERWDRATLALEIQYARAFAGADIAERSLAEMRRQGELPESQGKRWLAAMAALFPDVKPGDRLVGVRRNDGGTRFYADGQRVGEIDDAEFGRRFFGIWLAPQTSEPTLRSRLLGLGG
ncbi:MAG: chalcone isomerase family protein [Rubrivivax sp.]